MNEKEKETMERVIEKANNPKVAEAAAIFASGYASGYDAGMATGSEKEPEDKETYYALTRKGNQ